MFFKMTSQKIARLEEKKKINKLLDVFNNNNNKELKKSAKLSLIKLDDNTFDFLIKRIFGKGSTLETLMRDIDSLSMLNFQVDPEENHKIIEQVLSKLSKIYVFDVRLSVMNNLLKNGYTFYVDEILEFMKVSLIDFTFSADKVINDKIYDMPYLKPTEDDEKKIIECLSEIRSKGWCSPSMTMIFIYILSKFCKISELRERNKIAKLFLEDYMKLEIQLWRDHENFRPKFVKKILPQVISLFKEYQINVDKIELDDFDLAFLYLNYFEKDKVVNGLFRIIELCELTHHPIEAIEIYKESLLAQLDSVKDKTIISDLKTKIIQLAKSTLREALSDVTWVKVYLPSNVSYKNPNKCANCGSDNNLVLFPITTERSKTETYYDTYTLKETTTKEKAVVNLIICQMCSLSRNKFQAHDSYFGNSEFSNINVRINSSNATEVTFENASFGWEFAKLNNMLNKAEIGKGSVLHTRKYNFYEEFDL